MNIQFISTDTYTIRQIADELPAALKEADIDEGFTLSELTIPAAEPHRGDVVTLASIVLTAVSAGGAITVAMGKDGFLTRLAKVLEVWANRKVEVMLETEDGEKIHLSGSAGSIERILKTYLKP